MPPLWCVPFGLWVKACAISVCSIFPDIYPYSRSIAPFHFECNLPRQTRSLSQTEPINNTLRNTPIQSGLGGPSTSVPILPITPDSGHSERAIAPDSRSCVVVSLHPHPCLRNLRNWCGRSPRDRPSRLPDAPSPGRIFLARRHLTPPPGPSWEHQVSPTAVVSVDGTVVYSSALQRTAPSETHILYNTVENSRQPTSV